MTAWDKVLKARDLNRPSSLEYIENMFDDFIEFHGDRAFSDDKSFVCGIVKLNDISVTIIAQQRGRNVKENIERNFSMPNPEGYASILWKDSTRAKEAAERMKLTAEDLYNFGIIDKVIFEEGDIYSDLKEEIVNSINELSELDTNTLLEERYMKFRSIKGFRNV